MGYPNAVEEQRNFRGTGKPLGTRSHRRTRWLPTKRNHGIKPQPATAHNNTQPFPFLSLPAELRNCIYEYAGEHSSTGKSDDFQDSADNCIVPRYHPGRKPRWSPDHPGRDLSALARVSHQLHDETVLLYSSAKLLYYGSHTFEFDSVGMMRLFLNDIGPKSKDAIKSIKFTVLNETKLLDILEALEDCNGLERLEMKVSFSGSANYGENGTPILAGRPYAIEAFRRVIGPSLSLPRRLREFSISRPVPEACLGETFYFAKRIFDMIVEGEIAHRMERQRVLRELWGSGDVGKSGLVLENVNLSG